MSLSFFTEYMEQVNDQSIEDVGTVIADWRDIMSMIHFLASLCSMCTKAQPSWNSLARLTNNIYAGLYTLETSTLHPE